MHLITGGTILCTMHLLLQTTVTLEDGVALNDNSFDVIDETDSVWGEWIKAMKMRRRNARPPPNARPGWDQNSYKNLKSRRWQGSRTGRKNNNLFTMRSGGSFPSRRLDDRLIGVRGPVRLHHRPPVSRSKYPDKKNE
ncbi:hypothetical protein RB195_013791 [Necator americanus]